MDRHASVRIAKSSPLGQHEADNALLKAPPPTLESVKEKEDNQSELTAVERPFLPHVSQPEPIIQPAYAAAQVTALQNLRDQPTYVDCPFCQQRRLTRVTKYEEDEFQECCMCFWCGPQYVEKQKHIPTKHYCSSCDHLLVTNFHDGRPVQVEEPKTSQGLQPSMYTSSAPAGTGSDVRL